MRDQDEGLGKVQWSLSIPFSPSHCLPISPCYPKPPLINPAPAMPASPLQKILAKYRATSQTEREKGTYFRSEANYADV